MFVAELSGVKRIPGVFQYLNCWSGGCCFLPSVIRFRKERTFSVVTSLMFSAHPWQRHHIIPLRFCNSLKDRDPGVRIKANRALGIIFSEKRGWIVRFDNCRDHPYCPGVAQLFKDISDSAARPALRHALEDKDPAVRNAASHTLSELQWCSEFYALNR